MKKSVQLIVAGTLVMGLAACAGPSNRDVLTKNANYWQRSTVTDAALMAGPKSQQMLYRDLARCSTEMKELEYLGSARNAMPVTTENTQYNRAAPPETRERTKWEMPGRNSYQLAEHGKYMNFEGCMVDKGWERVERVPYDIATEDRDDYVDAIIGQRYRSKMGYRDNDTDYTVDEPRHNNDYRATGTNQ
jgi:hypothetical protein